MLVPEMFVRLYASSSLFRKITSRRRKSSSRRYRPGAWLHCCHERKFRIESSDFSLESYILNNMATRRSSSIDHNNATIYRHSRLAQISTAINISYEHAGTELACDDRQSNHDKARFKRENTTRVVEYLISGWIPACLPLLHLPTYPMLNMKKENFLLAT